MSIIVAEEQVFPLADVPDHVPLRRGQKRLNKATAFRWKDGLRGVKLETIRVGGTLCTSAEALQRFFRAALGHRFAGRGQLAAHSGCPSPIHREG